jgi:GTP-binding protein
VKFIDEASVVVQSGNGGNGCVSFRREKFIPKGGPDGGDGGHGGSVVFRATTRKRTLHDFWHQKHFRAPSGAHGQGRQKTGRSGKDLVVEVPPGTLIYNADTGDLIKDFTEDGETAVIAVGGRGGQGNARFKSSTHRTPRFAQPGEEGQALNLRLELKLLADVGIIGLPNAGKSTLISRISSARPQVADYPFTTLIPQIGMVTSGYGEPFAVADIPGLIEGAHLGVGLGIRFLRHVERTRILLHLVDAAPLDGSDALDAYDTVNRELAHYSPVLAQRPQLLVLNKLDITEAAETVTRFRERMPEVEVHTISAATGKGVPELVAALGRALEGEDG